MRVKRRLIILFATAAVLGALIGGARAQENLPFGPENYEEDLQMFSPFTLDLDNMSDKQTSGYFFNYNKLFWSYNGERVTVGSNNVTDTLWFRQTQNGQVVQHDVSGGEFAEVIYEVNTNLGNPDLVNPNVPVPLPYIIHNTLNNVPPKAGFAFGNRYELGYHDQGHGWSIGVLDGPQLNQTETFGFIPRADGGIPPFIPPDYTGGNDVGPSTGPIAGGNLRAFGFGSVPVLFETPPGYLLGFRDYVNNLADAIIGTQVGPIAYVGSYGASSETQTTLPAPEFRIADDINGNGIPGAEIVLVNGLPVIVHDFNDLHKFDIFFDSVTVHNRTQVDGVELMWSHDLTTQNYMAKNQNNQVTVAGGARFLRLYDEFDVDALGSILGHSFWDTSYGNNIVGPQVQLQWVNERQRWRIQTDARLMAGVNIANWSQLGLMGEALIPGALNQPLYARPTAFSHGLQEVQFAPVGELRVAATYHVTSAFALNCGYTGSVVGGIHRAAPSVHYSLPDMGFLDAGTQALIVNGVDFGVEFVH